MSFEIIKEIKELAVKAIYSDDHLMEIFVFKGGSAIDMFYPNMAYRSSMDLDFSIETDIDLDKTSERIKKTLEKTFNEKDYHIFDYSMESKPEEITDDVKDFWGGYKVEFKIIKKEKYNQFKDDIQNMRRNAINIGIGQKKKFSIDISKYEYCGKSVKHDLDDLRVIVYSPEMLAFEKLRAICQQMPEYNKLVHRNRKVNTSNRARDFFDFYNIYMAHNIDITSPENIEIIKKVFESKRVPLDLISKIKDLEEFYEQGFQSVKDTVNPGYKIKKFGYYFDFLVEECEKLESLGII